MYNDIFKDDEDFKEKFKNYVKNTFEDAIDIVANDVPKEEVEIMKGFSKSFMENDIDGYANLYIEYFPEDELKRAIESYDKNSIKKAMKFSIKKSTPFILEKLFAFMENKEKTEMEKLDKEKEIIWDEKLLNPEGKNPLEDVWSTYETTKI